MLLDAECPEAGRAPTRWQREGLGIVHMQKMFQSQRRLLYCSRFKGAPGQHVFPDFVNGQVELVSNQTCFLAVWEDSRRWQGVLGRASRTWGDSGLSTHPRPSPGSVGTGCFSRTGLFIARTSVYNINRLLNENIVLLKEMFTSGLFYTGLNPMELPALAFVWTKAGSCMEFKLVVNGN